MAKINGNGNDNTLVGTNGKDTINGKGGHDLIKGKAGNDYLLGAFGNDKVYGGGGNDQLSGGNGRDKLFGGSGNDKLFGGKGNDELRGGAGKDKFYFEGGKTGKDFIYDFKDNVDTLYISKSYGFETVEDVIDAAHPSGGSTPIDLSGEGKQNLQIVLLNYDKPVESLIDDIVLIA